MEPCFWAPAAVEKSRSSQVEMGQESRRFTIMSTSSWLIVDRFAGMSIKVYSCEFDALAIYPVMRNELINESSSSRW